MKSPVFRRLQRRPPICLPSPVFIRPSPATMNTSATARSPCWQASNLVTGKVHALVKERHRSREFIEFLKLLAT